MEDLWPTCSIKKRSRSRGKKLCLFQERMAGQEKDICWHCSRVSDDWNNTRVCTGLHCAIERRKFGSAAMPSHTSTRWSPGQWSFRQGALKIDRRAVLWRRKSQTPVGRRSRGRSASFASHPSPQGGSFGEQYPASCGKVWLNSAIWWPLKLVAQSALKVFHAARCVTKSIGLVTLSYSWRPKVQSMPQQRNSVSPYHRALLEIPTTYEAHLDVPSLLNHRPRQACCTVGCSFFKCDKRGRVVKA